jgi:hypothetical protein
MYKVLFFLALFTSFSVAAQSGKDIPIGVWRSHSSSSKFNNIMLTDDEVFASSPETFVKFNLTENVSYSLSKNNGYSDVGVSELRYYPERNLYLIGYENGNIDLVADGIIHNINDIKRKPILGSKAINHISFKGRYAYLAADFGLVIIDLDKREIKDAGLNIGPGGKSLSVISTALKGDSIYIATTTGIFSASLQSNLLNYANWKSFGKNQGIPTRNLKGLAVLRDTVYGLVTSYYNASGQLTNTDSAGVYRMIGEKWTRILPVSVPSNSINVSRNKVVVSSNVLIYTIDGSKKDSLWMGGNSNETEIDENGHFWVAAEYAGLVGNKAGGIDPYHPNGPFSSVSFKLAYGNKTILNLYGGYLSNTVNYFSEKGYDAFENNSWVNISTELKTLKDKNNQNITGRDFVDAVYNPANGYTYIASYGYGLFELKDNKVNNIFNDLNSTLVNVIPGSPYVRASAVALDSMNVIWAGNATSSTLDPLLSSYSGGKWTAHVPGLPSEYSNFTPYEIDIDGEGNKWVRFRGISTTLLVFNEKRKENDRFKLFKAGAGQGGLPSGKVLSIAVDKKGEVWVGTEKGIAIMKKDVNPFGAADFTIPYYDGFPLLMDKEVFAIEVDGGNRKWVGTKNGLWLFNEDATKAIAFFDEDNSPLPSSDIKDIEINHSTGEIFIITSKGMISYRGMSTEGPVGKFESIKVFPNPVKPGFSGNIGISGLARDASVKITDIYGNMVFETYAEGGTAVWNGKNYNNERVSSGVYLILSATIDGQEGYVGKIAIVE